MDQSPPSMSSAPGMAFLAVTPHSEAVTLSPVSVQAMSPKLIREQTPAGSAGRIRSVVSAVTAASLGAAAAQSSRQRKRLSRRLHRPRIVCMRQGIQTLEKTTDVACDVAGGMVGSEDPQTRVGEQPAGIWHQYALKEDWYAEYDDADEFGPTVGKIEGCLPEELRGGVFYRNGPGKFSRGGTRYNHIIDGDGMILQISFPQDKTDEFVAQARFIRTETFLEEESENRICARSSFGTQRQGIWALQNIMDAKIKNCANTHVVPWGGKLLALFETGLPYALDPETLKTLGAETFDGRLRPGTAASINPVVDSALGFGDAVTAHPHIDMANERFLIWSNRNNALDGNITFTVSEYDNAWNQCSDMSFVMDAGTAPHDFAFTNSFYIWCENRMELGNEDLAKYLIGMNGPAEGVKADASAPCRIHLVLRGTARARHLIVETPAWFCIHHSHAEEYRDEEGATIVTIYSAGWTGDGLSRNDGRFLAAWKGYAPDFDVIPATHYWKTRVRVTDEGATLLDHNIFPGMEAVCMDHPHVHPAEEGSSGASYTYMTYSNSEGWASPSVGWMRLDVRTGETVKWTAGKEGDKTAGCFCLEPVVVPKKSGSGAWMLGVVNDHRKDKSYLCIFDGDDFEKGPVCKAWLPGRLAHALHGSFMAPDSA